MKFFFSIACLATALAFLASCGGGPKTTAAPAGVQEFDQASGTWKPATKIVQAPPHQEGGPPPKVSSSQQVIATSDHRSMWQKMGDTAKKPLHWVGLGKDDSNPPPPMVANTSTTKKADAPPPPPASPIDPKPGAKSLWQSIGDGLKAPFHWIGL